jgi:hypothetical protein
MISRISGAAYLTETHGSSIRLIRIRDYASDHVELHSFVCTPGHATRSDAYPTRQRGHGVRFSSMFEPSGKRARDERCAVGPSFTPLLDHPSQLLDHPSQLLDHPSQLLDHPSQLLDHPSRQAGSHLALGGTGSTQDLRSQHMRPHAL